MFSYFFNTSPLSTLSSLHSVLANYTCKANRKLNIPTSRDCWGSGALIKRCGGGCKVGHSTGACTSPASKALSHPRGGGGHKEALQGWGAPPCCPPELQGRDWAGAGGLHRSGKGCPPSKSTTGWWHRAEEGLCPDKAKPHWPPQPPQPGSVNIHFLLWKWNSPKPMCSGNCCLTLLLSHIQAVPKLPSKLCQTIWTTFYTNLSIKNLNLLSISSDRTNNAIAFRVTFPHRTNPLLKFVHIFLVAPVLELCRSITVMLLSEAVQSSQPKPSDCLELLKINSTVLLAFSPDLAALQFPLSELLSLRTPSHHPQQSQPVPQCCPRRTNSPSRKGAVATQPPAHAVPQPLVWAPQSGDANWDVWSTDVAYLC